jgi:N-acetylneuraminic acid mutarotase
MFEAFPEIRLRALLVSGLIAISSFGPISLEAAAQGGSSSFTTIDVQGAGTGTLQGTGIIALDPAGDAAGAYIDANSAYHGFIRAANGTITEFDATGAGAGKGQGTLPISMDSAGDVAGMYISADSAYHGFVRTANGTITTFDDPSAGTGNGMGLTVGTRAMSISAGTTAGNYTIVGDYKNASSVYYGFIRDSSGNYTTINAAGAGTAAYQGTACMAINSVGTIAGRYLDSNSLSHGFARAASGTITEFVAPNATTTGNFHGNYGTIPIGIDTNGDIAGVYTDARNLVHGFFRTASGAITSFDPPGVATVLGTGSFTGTFGFNMDSAGDITGTYTDVEGILHGFLRTVDNGTITSFDAPGAGSSGNMQGTGGVGISINSNGTGVNIAGAYVDTNSVMHGFFFSPALTGTTTTLTPAPAPNPSVYQEPVTLTATVTSSGNAPPNGENVTFLSGTTSLGTAQLTSGTASLTTTALPVGTDSITAIYSGDSDYSGSTSTAVNQVVNRANSFTTLQSSLNPSPFGQFVTLTANISGQFGGIASGTVTFNIGSTSLGSASVSRNSAGLTTAILPQGTDSVTAAYSGDSNFIGSTSNSVSQVVTSPPNVVGQWTWVGGSRTLPGANQGQTGVYGTLGVAATANIPGGRDGAVSWTDKSGNLWIFGGDSYNNSTGSYNRYNDLWELSASTGYWTWKSGSNTTGNNCYQNNHRTVCGQAGVYGTPEAAASGNVPGGRTGAASWTDGSGNLWLFGGNGFDAGGNYAYLNDLWEYSPATGLWTWVSGSKTVPSSGDTGNVGVYGTMGTAAAGNTPGSSAAASSWTDQSGNLWLFGGAPVFDSTGSQGTGYLNDLWEFNPSTKTWTWMGGSNTASGSYQSGVFGTLGVPAAGNTPGDRGVASTWTDASGNLWLFGGELFDGNSSYIWLNDLWEFNPSTLEWAWMGGSSTLPGWNSGDPGVYGALNVPASGNFPGGRGAASSWTDCSGNFWLFGGEGIDAAGTIGGLNDLWQFNPSMNEWAWMGGSGVVGNNCGQLAGTMVCGQPGVYGTLGTAAIGNVPGARAASVSWIDGNGNLWLFGGEGADTTGTFGYLNDLWELQLPAAVTPAFGVAPATYASAQSVTISDATAGATIYYTTNGTTPNTSSTKYTGAITVSSSETLEAIAAATDYSTSAVATAAYTINLPQTATPTFSPAAGTYISALSVAISSATTGATIYYTTNGTTPTASSTVYSGPITVSSTETLEAIATASGYSTSPVATAVYTINIPSNPVPVLGNLSPAFTSAGGAAFTLAVTGTGFTTASTVYWGTSALSTTYESATQLSAQVPAADIATGGITAVVTVLTPAPGGGTSNSFQFEVDSASGTTGPTFTSTTATVAAGSTATYPVTLPSDVSSVSVTCLNLPTGATCSYSSTAGTVSIATSSTTPTGTYQVTVVFTETVAGAASGFILFPTLLLPLLFLRRKLASSGTWIAVSLGLVLLVAVPFILGCGGGGSGSSISTSQTHQSTSSGSVSLTVQ